MNQNFGLLVRLVPMLFVRKIITNRALTSPKYFRRRCDVGDLMYFFSNARTPEMKREAEGIVVFTNEWQVDQMPREINEAKRKKSPAIEINWHNFAYIDGFNSYNDFTRFFEVQSKKKSVEAFKMFSFVEHKLLENQTIEREIWKVQANTILNNKNAYNEE